MEVVFKMTTIPHAAINLNSPTTLWWIVLAYLAFLATLV
jgi:hypothetical protein